MHSQVLSMSSFTIPTIFPVRSLGLVRFLPLVLALRISLILLLISLILQ